MAFEWVIRHQKKALFVLAVVLVVGWGIGGMISMMVRSGGHRGTDVTARIAGEDVTYNQIMGFRREWGTVYPALISRERGGRSDDSEKRAWAWFGLLAMARQQGVQVADEYVIYRKRQILRQLKGDPNARLDASADAAFRAKLGMTGQQLDDIVRQELMAEKMLDHMVGALQVTKEEAWEQYAKENCAFRVRAAEFPATDFIAKTPEPDNEKIQTWYKMNSGPGGFYYNPPTLQIEYVQAMLDKLEAGVTVTSDEMKAYYDKNKDLYLLTPAGGGKEAEYLPFPEVKPEIEESLKRKAVNDRAKAMLDDVRAAYMANPDAGLEDVVKALKGKYAQLEYVRSPFLTDVQFLDLAGIGVAHSEGRNLPQIAFEMAKTATPPHELSPVMSTAEGRWVFRPAAPQRDGTTPSLDEVKGRVIADLRKDSALLLARDAAAEFDNAVLKAGPDSFDKLAAEKKIAVTQSPFFRNNIYDAARPDFIDPTADLAVGKVYGPWVSTREYVAAAVKVTEERPADRSGFTSEEESREKEQVLKAKRNESWRLLMPDRILEIARYQDLRPRETKKSEDNATMAAPKADNATAPRPTE